ncbi:MAG: PEP-CTERM sorting domain-containing protein [Phycisphaeraceae bacterium]
MQDKMQYKLGFTSALVAGLVFAPATMAGTVLFADDYSDGSVVAPAGVNDPDPRFDAPDTTVTIADNLSVSGTIPAGFGPDDLVYTGHSGGIYEEKGGFLEFGSTGAFRGALQLRSATVDLASNIVNGELTLFFDGVNPIVGGDGSTNTWFAFSLATNGANIGGGNVKVNKPEVSIGALFRENGELNAFSTGSSIGTAIFDATPADGTYDIRVDLTNITATTMDYDIVVDGGSVKSGSVAGVDTSTLILTMETTGSNSSLERLAIETAVPEPTSLGLLGVGALCVMRRRKLG